MEDTKKWWESFGIWGAVVTIASVGAQFLGFEIPMDLTADVNDFVMKLVTLVAGAIALWGRVKATKRVGCTLPSYMRSCSSWRSLGLL